MPKSRTPSDGTVPPAVTEPHESARAKIQSRIAKGEKIRGRIVQVDGDAYLYNKDLTKWDEYNVTLLRSLFTGAEIFDNYRWGTAPPGAADHESYMAEYRRRVSSLNDKMEFLESLVDRIEAMPLAPAIATSSPARDSGNGHLIFLSHAALDVGLAAYVEEALRASIGPVRVFRTSRVGQMTAGKGWFEQIRENLMQADAYIVLVTPRSHDRWWVLFEAGAALRSEKTFVPMLAGGLTPSSVNEPLRYLTLRNIEQVPDAEQAVRELGGRLHDAPDFVAQVKRLAEQGTVVVAEKGRSDSATELSVKYVDLNYPNDSGLQGQLEADGYRVAWCSDSKLARKLDIDGWELVYQTDRLSGRKVILKLKDRPEDQTLVRHAR